MQVVLRPGETVIKQFSVGKRLVGFLFVIAIIVAVVVSLGILAVIPAMGYDVSAGGQLAAILAGLLVGSGMAFYGWYLRTSHEYTLTNERIIQMVGWLSKSTVFTDFQDITDITVDQDIFQKLVLNIGTLHINTAGSSTEEINYDAIEDPYGVTSTITDLCSQHFAKLGIVKAKPTVMGQQQQPSQGE